MSHLSINERVFADLNANPNIPIEDLIKGDKRKTVTAVRNFWRKTRHKEYTSSSSVPDPVTTARSILAKATKEGLSEAEGRDLAIDAGVAHGTAFAVAAEVYRDFRREQPKLKGARGTWTVKTDSGLEMPVCHNIRVDWGQVPPVYNDALRRSAKNIIDGCQRSVAVMRSSRRERSLMVLRRETVANTWASTRSTNLKRK